MIDGVERVMPGDNTTITGELLTQVALEKGARFAIRGDGRTVGVGTMPEIIEQRSEARGQRSEDRSSGVRSGDYVRPPASELRPQRGGKARRDDTKTASASGFEFHGPLPGHWRLLVEVEIEWPDGCQLRLSFPNATPATYSRKEVDSCRTFECCPC